MAVATLLPVALAAALIALRDPGTASPVAVKAEAVKMVLRPNGTLTSVTVGDWDEGGGILPGTIEIPVGFPSNEFGRSIVQTNGRANVSLEERRAAATIATTLARCIRP